MFKKIFFILGMFIFPAPIFAQTMDSSALEMYQTISLEQDIQYSMQDLTNEAPVSRFYNVGSNIQGVPGTKFNLVYRYFNYGVDDIFVEKVFVPMSTENSKMYELIKNSEGLEERDIHTKWGNVDLYRNTIGKEYILNREVLSMQGGSVVLEEIEIKDSLVITKVDMTEDEENAKMYFTVKVQNLTDELLNNIVFEHQTYSYTQNILPNDEVIYQYFLETDFFTEEIQFGRIKISDPNTKTDCANEGSRWYQYYYTNAISMYSYIANSWYSGLYIQPNRDSICITRLPHEIYSDELIWKKEIAVDNYVDEIEEPMVLGVQSEIYNTLVELPKTAYRQVSLLMGLLVADIYLWYSVFNKRRNYENKNNNTRICSRSSK